MGRGTEWSCLAWVGCTWVWVSMRSYARLACGMLSLAWSCVHRVHRFTPHNNLLHRFTPHRHSGAIHALLALVIQYYVCKSIEKQAGFLRTLLIYFISGIGGYTISGNFAPEMVSLGADPAVPYTPVHAPFAFRPVAIHPHPVSCLL